MRSSKSGNLFKDNRQFSMPPFCLLLWPRLRIAYVLTQGDAAGVSVSTLRRPGTRLKLKPPPQAHDHEGSSSVLESICMVCMTSAEVSNARKQCPMYGHRAVIMIAANWRLQIFDLPVGNTELEAVLIEPDKYESRDINGPIHRTASTWVQG
jgi:hypothetical protein